MNKVIIPTGYMGSGSSALTDLMGEFRGFEINHGNFEYIFLHCPNGLFDLEDKLLVGNNAVRSDEAIRSFRCAMEDLFYSKTWWPGNYRKNLSSNFMKIVDEFLDAIIDHRANCHWYPQEKLPVHRIPQRVFANTVNKLTRGAIRPKVPLLYDGMQLSYISARDFYSEARRFLDSIFSELGIDEHGLLLDQLLLPFNTWRMSRYFDNNVECFIVARDPRDVFLLNKYVWVPNNEGVAFPTDVEAFCTLYRKMRDSEHTVNDQHIHRIHFEELIYNYEQSIEKIAGILDLDPSCHNNKGGHFCPSRSIANTQLFNLSAYQQEGRFIQHQLPEFLFDFPYDLTPDSSKAF